MLKTDGSTKNTKMVRNAGSKIRNKEGRAEFDDLFPISWFSHLLYYVLLLICRKQSKIKAALSLSLQQPFFSSINQWIWYRYQYNFRLFHNLTLFFQTLKLPKEYLNWLPRQVSLSAHALLFYFSFLLPFPLFRNRGHA